ncbi:uncharacterized protein TNCV_4938591 [Trichonephila clavipes]|nr:uncharacterized protein TNCV_4938591 [Trichonephila clavipes]
MNLPLSKRFNKKESGLDTAVETVATMSMQIAAKEAKNVSGHSYITVAIDGTWQKRGHTSLNGAVIATSFYTSKVLDASILSRFYWLSETIPIVLIVLIQCTDSINSMKRAIWATYFHKAFIDAYQQHGLCPTNEDTWCEYNRAITTGEVYEHKNTLPSEKNIFVQLGILKTGILEPIASYNQGNITKCLVLATLCILPGFYLTRGTETADRERLRKANYDILQNSKETRVKKSHKKCILEDTLAEERKTPSYEAAMH